MGYLEIKFCSLPAIKANVFQRRCGHVFLWLHPLRSRRAVSVWLFLRLIMDSPLESEGSIIRLIHKLKRLVLHQ